MKRLITAVNVKDIEFEPSDNSIKAFYPDDDDEEEEKKLPIGQIDFSIEDEDEDATYINVGFLYVSEEMRFTNLAKLLFAQMLERIKGMGIDDAVITAEVINANLLTYLKNRYEEIAKEFGVKIQYKDDSPLKNLPLAFLEASNVVVSRNKNKLLISVSADKRILRSQFKSSGMKILNNTLSDNKKIKQFIQTAIDSDNFDISDAIEMSGEFDEGFSNIMDKLKSGNYTFTFSKTSDEYKFDITVDI